MHVLDTIYVWIVLDSRMQVSSSTSISFSPHLTVSHWILVELDGLFGSWKEKVNRICKP